MSRGDQNLFCADTAAAPPAIRRAWRSRTRISSQALQRSHNIQRCVEAIYSITLSCGLHREPCSPDCLPVHPAATAMNNATCFQRQGASGALLCVDMQLGIRLRAVKNWQTR